MTLHIRPMSINDGILFTAFMDRVDFSHQPNWQGCYCRFYHSGCTYDQWMKLPKANKRDEALTMIADGFMHGYLAFDNEQMIGWLNAGHWENYLRLAKELSKHADLDTAVLICFLIDEKYRNQGIAKKLLAYALEDLSLLGFKRFIAIPHATKEVSELNYRGTMHMYEEHGFKSVEELSGQVIMVLDQS